jgi:GWxTD domain-containing protein
MILNKQAAYVFLILICFSACKGVKQISSENRAGIYQDKSLLLDVDYTVQHNNDSISQLIYQFPLENLLFVKNGSGKSLCDFMVIVKFYSSYNSSDPFSTDTLKDFQIQYSNTTFTDSLKLNLGLGKSYLIEIVFRDKHRDFEQSNLLYVEKENRNQHAFFNASKNNTPLFKPLINVGDSIRIGHYKAEQIFVRYYNRAFRLAHPPFNIYNDEAFDFNEDSSFIYYPNQNIVFNKPGMYHFQTGSNQVDGYTIICNRKNYPCISEATQMIEPLRFITTNREYENLISDTLNIKKNIDELWLDAAGNAVRARLLISTYYGRVEKANKLFTSYHEGWRTDRGMIYTVFGAPNILYQTQYGETWVYGKESSSLSYAFNFSKVTNPFSDNDYQLNRSSMYRASWSVAVDFWRQGRIFNSNTARQEQQYYERQQSPIWY